MERLRSQAKETYTNLLEDARSYNLTAKEQVAYINEQIRASEKRNQVETMGAKAALQSRRDELLASAGPDSRRSDVVKKDYASSLSGISNESTESRLQTQLLRELVQAAKDSAREETRDSTRESQAASAAQDQEVQQESEQDGEQSAQSSAQYLRGFATRGGNKRHRIRMINPDEVPEGEDGDPLPEPGAAPAVKRGFFATMFGRVPEDYGDDHGGEHGGEPRPEVAPEEERKRKMTLADADARARQATQYATNPMSAVAALPIVGGLLAFMGIQGNKLQEAGGKLEGATGNGYKQFGNPGRFGVGDSTPFGVSRADFMEYATGLAKSRGSGRGLEGEALNYLASEKATGLSMGGLNAFARNEQYDKGNRGPQNFQTFVKSMREGGMVNGNDYSRLEDLMSVNNQLTEQQGSMLEKVNGGTVAAMVAMGGKIGGAFAGPQMGQRLSGLNGALSRPDNDYTQAFNFSVIRGMKGNENKSLVQLRMMEEQGLGLPGFAKASMGALGKEAHGDHDLFVQLVKSRKLAGSYNDANQMVDAYEKDPNSFDINTIKGNARKRGGVDSMGRGAQMTPGIPKLLSKINDMGAYGGDAVISSIEKEATEVSEKGVAQYTKDKTAAMVSSVSASMKEASKGMIKAVKDQMHDVGRAIGHGIKENLGFGND